MKIRNQAIQAELKFDKYYPNRKISEYEKFQTTSKKRRGSVGPATNNKLFGGKQSMNLLQKVVENKVK